ncbi:MAG TPA: hypothetical protein VLK23_13590 [Thermodesulfobacteriota bacterium]|nr:hypothetical protein [Thermodesulfobacteriota bacterium]
MMNWGRAHAVEEALKSVMSAACADREAKIAGALPFGQKHGEGRNLSARCVIWANGAVYC